jgi:hypothetical protein
MRQPRSSGMLRRDGDLRASSTANFMCSEGVLKKRGVSLGDENQAIPVDLCAARDPPRALGRSAPGIGSAEGRLR